MVVEKSLEVRTAHFPGSASTTMTLTCCFLPRSSFHYSFLAHFKFLDMTIVSKSLSEGFPQPTINLTPQVFCDGSRITSNVEFLKNQFL